MAEPKPTLLLTANQDIERFLSKVAIRGNDECWEWTAGCFPDDYGEFYINSAHFRAHRWLYQRVHSVVLPREILVRHRCDNPPCCNPKHLLEGTQQDNVRDRVERNRTAKGDKSAARLHPEMLKRGEDHWTHKHPEKLKRGDEHHARKNPEKVIRGEAHHFRKHPERAPRGDNHWTRKNPERLARGERSGAALHPELVLKGEKHGQAKLTEEQVLEIRAKAKHVSQRKLAAEYHVSQSIINNIILRKNWKHV